MNETQHKTLVCVDLTSESIDLIKSKINKIQWENKPEVILCHVFLRKVYADNFFISSYPAKDDEESIEKAVLQVLQDLGNEIFGSLVGEAPSWRALCLIATSKKSALSDYIFEKDINEVFVGTSNKHGISEIFTSSLAEYLVSNTPCDIRVFKPSVLIEN